jgi:hypothetical protein
MLPVNSHRWSFNFQDAPWLSVLRAFCREFNFSLQVDADAEGSFSHYNEQPLSSTETMDIFNDALLATGRILIRDQQRITLVNATATIPEIRFPSFPSLKSILWAATSWRRWRFR